MISLSKIQSSFLKIETPKYLDQKIQSIALKHLNLKDVGELRDRYDGQLYLNNLRDDIRSEFAFENFINYQFEWKKRENLNYKRLKFNIENREIQISNFNLHKNPTIDEIKPTVIVFLKPEKYAYIGPIILENELESIINNTENTLTNKITIDLEKINLENLYYFKNYTDLKKLLL